MSHSVAYASQLAVHFEEPAVAGAWSSRAPNAQASIRIDKDRMDAALNSKTFVIPEGLTDADLDAFIIAAANQAK